MLLWARLARFAGRRATWRPAMAVFGTLLFIATGCSTVRVAEAAVPDVTAVSQSSSAQTDVPLTFGQVFKSGDLPSSASLIARLPGGAQVPAQFDRKTAYPDGSAKHGVVTVMLPSLGANASQVITLDLGTATSGPAVSLNDLLATSFDATVTLNVGGTSYSASARDLLQLPTRQTWLSGPVVSEWIASGPVRTSAGVAHTHLQAQFAVRAYAGLQRVRVSVAIENIFALVPGPQRYTYDLTVGVQGKGTVLTRTAVPHYNQSRWRRVFWWGPDALADVRHNSAYLMATRAVPTYDSRLSISGGTLDQIRSAFRSNSDLMDIGDLNASMPAGGGRGEIAPIPLWAAAYVVTSDLRAKESTVGHGDQAGAWPMHYRDAATGLPISLDTYPNIGILGGTGLPNCGGNCSTPYEPEVAHHPTLAYVPYLITGDYYLMEEMQFWANWVMFYGESNRHGGAQGLVVWDGIRGQAWAMRTLAQAAYATPDAHPLKNYFNAKLQNNLNFYNTTWLNSNPLGYITHTGPMEWTGLRQWVATWMDDFLTWSFGHIVALGYDDALPMLQWKAKFPVGRLTDPNMCWILASTYWPTVMDNVYLGGSGQPVDTWDEWRRTIIWSWDDDAFRPPSINIAGREQELINASCDSSQMSSILGLSQGYMIGWDGADGYGANMQPAVAVAIENGIPNAQAAFDRLMNARSFPRDGFNSQPQWAIFPASGGGASGPSISFSANPTTVDAGDNSTLTWNASNATSCTASGGWSGNKATSGSQSVGPINATTSYVLTCTNGSASSSSSLTVTVAAPPPPAPTVTLNANPTSVQSGGSSQLTWSSTNANSCTASGGWSGSRNTSGNATINNITANTTFTLQCTGAGGSAQRSVTVQVMGAPPAPTVTLSANPTTVNAGSSATLNWSSTNANSCTASGGWTGTKATSGNQSTGALNATTMFVLACTGAGGSAQQSVTVTVNQAPPAPTVNLSANPTSVAVNDSATLTWTSTNATSCSASGGWSGSKATSGNQSTGALTNTTTYNLSCTGAGGSAQDSVTVSVTPGGGGGGGGTQEDSGGGGSLEWLSLGILLLLARRRLVWARSAQW
jgi:hypothetical protein